jgi:hypothetical protein
MLSAQYKNLPLSFGAGMVVPVIRKIRENERKKII